LDVAIAHEIVLDVLVSHADPLQISHCWPPVVTADQMEKNRISIVM